MDITELYRARDAYYARKAQEAKVEAPKGLTAEIKAEIEMIITECYTVTLLLMRMARMSAAARFVATLWAVITKAMLLAYEQVLVTA